MARNTKAATEDEIGMLHMLISKLHNLKAGTMLKLAKILEAEGAEGNEESLRELLLIINSKDISSIQKWVEYNKVGCMVAEDDEESELSKSLAELKKKQSGNVVEFKDVLSG